MDIAWHDFPVRPIVLSSEKGRKQGKKAMLHDDCVE